MRGVFKWGIFDNSAHILTVFWQFGALFDRFLHFFCFLDADFTDTYYLRHMGINLH